MPSNNERTSTESAPAGRENSKILRVAMLPCWSIVLRVARVHPRVVPRPAGREWPGSSCLHLASPPPARCLRALHSRWMINFHGQLWAEPNGCMWSRTSLAIHERCLRRTIRSNRLTHSYHDTKLLILMSCKALSRHAVCHRAVSCPREMHAAAERT